MQISYNKLKTFGECALKYRYTYIERLPRAPIRSLGFHRKLHAALGQYHHFAKRDGIVREEELLKAYARIWEVERDSSLRESKEYQEGEEILRRYCETENGKNRVPAYLEHPLKVAFGPYQLTGKIDRIDFTDSSSYSIVDYKLDRHLPTHNQAEESQQLSFYHLLVSEGLGVDASDVRLYYLRHGVEQISVRTRAQRKETVEWIDDTASAIHREKQWDPQQGAGCITCAFKKLCPAKTGRNQPLGEVWQQGNLLWEMQSPQTESEPVVAATPTSSVRQMTLEELL
jgi:RecB family exonuclease